MQHVIGGARGLSAAKGMGLSGTYISVGGFAPGLRRALGVDYTVVELAQIGRQLPTSTTPSLTAEAAVLFTSGATGPAKGVVYRHAQLEAQREIVRGTFGIQPDDRLVAAFAPFALFGPALGITSAVPDMDISKPGTLTSRALADAVSSIDATLVFAAPDLKRGAVGGTLDLVHHPSAHHHTRVVPGVMAVEASQQLGDWFRRRRRQGGLSGHRA